MRITSTGVVALLLALAGCTPGPRRGAAASPAPDATRLVAPAYTSPARTGAEVVRAYMDASGAPGISVAVAVRGELAWSQGFGHADVEQAAPVTRQTRFRLGSVSKLLAAATLVKLSESGAIGLDQPIRRYVPAFPTGGDAITPRLLAGHLGGIRHYTAADFGPAHNIDQTVYRSTGDALAIFQRDTLLAAPGSRYRYSTFGYTLLSAAVEGAAGQDFLSALQRTVLDPLRLAHTGADHWEAPVPHRTHFYRRGERGEAVHDQPVISSYKWAGGGLLSTAEDLVRFGSAHLAPGFFREESLRELFSSQVVAGGGPTHVGIGWRIAQDPEGRLLYHHAGSMEGCRSVLLVYPREGVVVALLSNRASSPESPELMAHLLAQPFLAAGGGDAGHRRRAESRIALRVAGTDAGETIGMQLSGDGLGWMRSPAALVAQGRQSGFRVPDSVRVVAVGGTAAGEETFAVASPTGIHMLRLRPTGAPATGDLVWALQGPNLQPAAARVELVAPR